MPHVDFNTLPPNARLWVFGAALPLSENDQQALLHTIDAHLAQWRAHGVPLVAARDWRDERFVAVAVDEAATDASGCSIDGLFNTLAQLQQQIGNKLVGGGTLFWRDANGGVQSGARGEFVNAAREGKISAATPVFDLTVTTVADWRAKFERAASDSWHAQLL
jgi:nicotinamidase-related amidase